MPRQQFVTTCTHNGRACHFTKWPHRTYWFKRSYGRARVVFAGPARLNGRALMTEPLPTRKPSVWGGF